MLRTVKVPQQFEAIFQKAREYVARYFNETKVDPTRGAIEISGERYVLVRAASMSVEFFETIAALYQKEGKREAQKIACQLLFDLAHAIGRQDAKNLRGKLNLRDPIETLSAGSIHFAHAGWGLVDIAAESKPSPDEDCYLLYDHPYSFEAAAWLAAGTTADFPVCIMNAGYSSGWCEESFGLPLVASELLCRAKGDQACRFIMAPPSRMEGHITAYLGKEPELAKRITTYEIPGFFRRKDVEEALRGWEQKYHQLFENLIDAAFLADAQTGYIVDTNRQGERLLGRSREEIIGMHQSGLHPAGEADYYRRIFAEHVQKGRGEGFDCEAVRKDGSIVPVSISASLITHGGKRFFLGLFRDITERIEHEARIKKLNALLLAIRGINEHLLVADSVEGLYRFVCRTLIRLEDIAAVWIGMKAPGVAVKPVAWAGFDEAALTTLIGGEDPELADGIMSAAVRGGQPVYIRDLENDRRILPCRGQLQKWGVQSAAAVPLVADNEVFGSLGLYSRRRQAFDEEIVRFLAEVATDIAVGVRSVRLGRKLEATLRSLRESLNGTVAAIARMVEMRDPYTAGHERRVSLLASAIGAELGLPERQIEGLRVAGHIHDIGKIAVPAEILSKPTALTDIERNMVRAHAQAGYEILRNLVFPWPVAQAILQHHERLDGSGYPQGLMGPEIIIEARILMVADVVESMSSHRPYRPALGIEKALQEIVANQGKLYDPVVVDACVRLFSEKRFRFDGAR